MITKLTRADKKILYHLDIDARINYSELAKKVKTTKQVVRYRIQRLEKLEVIKNYYAIIDYSKLGLTKYRINLKLRNFTGELKEELFIFLKENNSPFAILSGKWDLAIGIEVETITKFYQFIDNLLSKYSPHIRDHSTCIYSPVYIFPKKYLLDTKEEIKSLIIENHQKEEINKKDLEIIKILSKDARISLLNLSKLVKLSLQLTRYRLKQLEKNKIIIGYRTEIDNKKLGYEKYKIYLRLNSYENTKKLYQFCLNHPNITLFNRTIGNETIEIEMQVRSIKDLLDKISKIGEVFPIEKFEYDYIMQIKK